jgi:hypothetical protein
MADRFLNVYFIPLPDPLGIYENITLHFVYDERKTPYLATPTIDESVDKLLLRVGSKQDVTVSFTHVGTAPADHQIRTRAAISVLEHFKGDVPTLRHVDPSEFMSDDGKFKLMRAVTVAEVAVFDEPSPGAEPYDTEIEDISDPFLRSLHCIKHFINAYNLSAEVPVRVPTYARVGPSVPLLRRLLTIENPDWQIHLQPLNHSNFGDDRPTKLLDLATIGQVLINVQLLSAGDIRALYRRAIVEAKQLCTIEGEYSSSIVKSAQACEILLDGTLGLVLWEEIGGAPLSDGAIDAAVKIFGGPLMSRVRKDYHPRLGGRWDPIGEGPVADWSRSVAGPRNRIVHRGYQPSADEAADALHAVHALDDYVTELIAAQARKFPRTALMWVGTEGLKRLGRWPLVRAFAQHRERTEPPWRDNYCAWRERVDAEVAAGRKRSPTSVRPAKNS